MRSLPLTLALLPLLPSLAAAQSDRAFAAALDSLRAGVTKTIQDSSLKKCADAPELEKSFELTRAGKTTAFSYAGCREEGRNDYLPPYTERSYKGANGEQLVIVTNDGEKQSEVLLWDGKAWAGRYGMQPNEKLASGERLAVEGGTLRAAVAEKVAPKVPVCDETAGKTGTLWLLTDTAAYYYHEDCDICAELTACDLKSHKLSSAITAHMISCDELAPYKKGKVVYENCGR